MQGRTRGGPIGEGRAEPLADLHGTPRRPRGRAVASREGMRGRAVASPAEREEMRGRGAAHRRDMEGGGGGADRRRSGGGGGGAEKERRRLRAEKRRCDAGEGILTLRPWRPRQWRHT
jgi:hypothetical protein